VRLVPAGNLTFIEGNELVVAGSPVTLLTLDPLLGRVSPAYHFNFEFVSSYNLTLNIRDDSVAPGGPPVLFINTSVQLVSVEFPRVVCVDMLLSRVHGACVFCRSFLTRTTRVYTTHSRRSHSKRTPSSRTPPSERRGTT
jgi:hypothetical protein